MLKNYLFVAVRSFLRQGLFSVLNVVGLAIGLACTLLIYLWVTDEVTKDKFHADIDRIYHVVTNIYNPEGVITWQDTPGPLAEEIRNNIPEAEYVAHIADDGARLIQYEDKSFLPNGYFTDPSFFQLFSYKIIKGNTANPLPNASSIVLTESLAKRIFGNEDPIGKSIKLRTENDVLVTAVVEDVTEQSSLTFDFIAHFDVHKKYRTQQWGNSDYSTFIKFKEGFDAHDSQEKINKHVAKVLNLSEEEQKEFQLYLQPFGDRYLYSSFENGFPVSGRIKYVKIFGVVAIFILLVACINFMNMATARAAVRHKEIGVRKVIGAQRWVLTSQFMMESILIAAMSMILALFVVELVLPFFNTPVVKKIDIRYDQIDFLLPIISIVLIAGILAGSYPAIVLSKVNPIRALKGATASASQGATLRRALVVFQFVISVVLIVSSLVVYKQIDFIQSKSLGYDKENVIIFSARGIKDYDVFKDQVSNVPGVINVSTAGESIIEINNQNDSFSWAGKSEESEVYVRTVSVGYDFIETLGFTLIKGRSFSRELNDTANVIINRKLASLMNVEDPIGLESEQWGVKGKIIGVVEDFHSRSLSENMDPMVLQCYPDWTSRFYIRIEPNKTGKVLTAVGNVWKTINPMYPFEYSFLDSHYERLYKEEHVIGKLALGFTLIAILISSLGLLGLAAYATERKKKEISVRKVLGATVPNLIVLMSTEFLLLASIALLIGCPLAYYFMNSFLAEYTYHTTIGYAVFVVTGVGLLLLTLFVVLLQVAKAAIANPTDNLRNE